ncbi:MAG: type II toxin-antitoxin system HicA family toxin [Candidatus Pacebacteria bacterium]|nr:type II toxin-antitoxin system HicA family toxin [Candidatus Paceibacterota bacterium]
MPKLKSLGSKEITKILESFGFEAISQKGSHIKFARQTSFQRQVLTIPNHKNIDKGTVKAIFNQASRFISSEALEKHFYTK